MIPDFLSMLDVFRGEHAPRFHCGVCGKVLSAHSGPTTMGAWQPSDCWHCHNRTKQRAAAKRRRENPRVLAGVDLDRAVAALRKHVPGLGGKPIKVSVGHRAEARWSGHAKRYRRAIRIAGGPGIRPAEVLEIIVHELCHLATPNHGHDERFRRVLRRAAINAWGIYVAIDPTPAPEDRGVIAYAMDRRIMFALESLHKTDDLQIYPPEPAKPKPSRAEKTAALVDKRAAHAAKMLAKAERKLKLAKTVHKRWAEKVCYYERVTAKRGGS